MKILEAGHKYELDGYDGSHPQELEFLKREGEGYPFNYGKHGGTNCQEVLRALIDRSEYLQKQVPCYETESIIGLLKTALVLFETRAARRHGLTIDAESSQKFSSGPFCKQCGHLVCKHSGVNHAPNN